MPKDEQKVDLVLLMDLMLELKVYIDYYQLKERYQKRAVAKRSNLFNSVETVKSSLEGTNGNKLTKHVLKRFTVFSSAALRSTIKKCEALGELQN